MKIAALAVLATSLSTFAQQITPPKPQQQAQPSNPHSPEINTTLMETTFLIFGPSSRVGETTSRAGTAFVMVRQLKKDSEVGQYVLITAKHVLEDIKGNDATLVIRRRSASGDTVASQIPLKIRDNDKLLYTAHPSADVAAIDINLPDDSIVVKLATDVTNTNWLATDDFLNDIKIHPGDELLCLGYPFGLPANDAGYAVLRSGKVASYPITPLKKVKTVLFDFRVLPGNSGGPVYFAFRDHPYKNQLKIGYVYQKVFGLVTQEVNPIQNRDPSIGIIVPAIFIKETIDLLAGFESATGAE